MQSYADTGFGPLREAGLFPSRAAVLGIVAAARGIGRDSADLVALHEVCKVHVATVLPGRRIVDYHSVEATLRREDIEKFRSWNRPKRGNKILTWRAYLCDAHFVAVVTSSDESTIERAFQAMCSPVYSTYLGRRACPPAVPLLPERVVDDPLHALLEVAQCSAESLPKTEESRRRQYHLEVACYLDGRYESPPGMFGGATPTFGTRRDLLVAPGRSYVTRPYTQLVWKPPAESGNGKHEEYFNATP